MLAVFRNELTKILKSKRFYIFAAIMVIISALFGIVVFNMQKMGTVSEKMMHQMIGGYFPIQILGIVSDMLLPIFSTLLAGFLITDEYNNGTLKLPLLCGHSRKNVLTAKIASISITMAFIMAVTFISSHIIAILIWGFNSVKKMFIGNMAIYGETFLAILSWGVCMVLLSLWIQNSGVLIGVVVSILVAGSLIGNVFPGIAKYILIYYFKAFSSLAGAINYLLAVGVCMGSMIVFCSIAYWRFGKLEIQK